MFGIRARRRYRGCFGVRDHRRHRGCFGVRTHRRYRGYCGASVIGHKGDIGDVWGWDQRRYR